MKIHKYGNDYAYQMRKSNSVDNTNQMKNSDVGNQITKEGAESADPAFKNKEENPPVTKKKATKKKEKATEEEVEKESL